MGNIHVHGGIPLQGEVKIQGSKNAALPIMAASVLTKGRSVLKGCPRISDVYHMQRLLESLGCKTRWEGEALRIEPGMVCMGDMPGDAVKGMRSSLTLLGALLGRCHKAYMDSPGGCVIGERPYDLHISALEQMNISFRQEEMGLYAWTDEIKGAEIRLSGSSVGATENIILAATLAKGKTVIYGAAREPEIKALCDFLNSCGADICGAGTDKIAIEGVEALHGAEFEIPRDRIVAGTYVLACTAVGGSVFLEGAPVEEMAALLDVTREMGAVIQQEKKGVYVQAPKRPKAIKPLFTEVYPGFPTDLQSPLLAVLVRGDGKSEITEQIFENRFRIVPELKKMGAVVQIKDGKTAYIAGQESLYGNTVSAAELRGGAALVIAGLAAQGETCIKNTNYIERGYVNICRDLRELGARIYCV